MNQDESVALWRRGKEAWNAWAKDMLRQKAELQKSGTWNGDKPQVQWSDETRKWIEAAQTDLSGLRFMTRALADAAEKQAGQPEDGSPPADADAKTLIIEGDGIDFSGFVFPWQANFQDVQFHGRARFRGVHFHGGAGFMEASFHGHAVFWNALFHGNAVFQDAQFDGVARFNGVRFHEVAGFWKASFHGWVDFGDVQFHEETAFQGAQFHEEALFERAQFRGSANFGSAQFHGSADFGSAQFQRQAQFASATFESSASFRHALFGSKAEPEFADFNAIKSDRAFNLTGAQFSKVPAFNQADFKQAPDLDSVSFPLPSRQPWRRGELPLIPMYRAIRRMAVQGADYEREQMAFKGELRSRRWTTDKWWHPSLWLGILYDGVADCGRSIIQPFAVWAATIIAFAAFYWSRAIAGAETRCAEGDGTFVQALYLSVKNALVLFAGTRDARVNQAYACLYNGTAERLHIPSRVTFVETIGQFPISAALIFLVLLAVKNRFKIK